MHPEYFEDELLFEYGLNKAQYFSKLNTELNNLLDEHKIDSKIATHFGSSTGKITFELTKRFDQVKHKI